jgi:hypothetical protein
MCYQIFYGHFCRGPLKFGGPPSLDTLTPSRYATACILIQSSTSPRTWSNYADLKYYTTNCSRLVTNLKHILFISCEILSLTTSGLQINIWLDRTFVRSLLIWSDIYIRHKIYIYISHETSMYSHSGATLSKMLECLVNFIAKCKLANWWYFFDRTNVRSKLLLLGHLPNLVGHCPMLSDSNLQPCNLWDFYAIKVTGHPFWRFAENRYCALNISSILIKFSPNVSQCMQNMVKL